jgi:putative two-component system response regulator
VIAKQQATVLVIDDSVESLAVLNELLRRQHRVLAATSGETGLRIAAWSARPDLILLDVMMPGMDGYAGAGRLRARLPRRDIPVIFLTSLGSAEDEGRGLEMGAADYITKPVSPAVLRARVSVQLEAKLARDWLRDQNATLDAEEPAPRGRKRPHAADQHPRAGAPG